MVKTYVFKVALLGDAKVGKTSLVRRFVHNKYDDKYLRTLGANIYKKDMVVEGKKRKYNIHFQIWDVLGQEDYTTVINSALNRVKGVIFVADVTNRESLVNLRKWIDRVYRNVGSATFVFVGNKADLPDKTFGMTELHQHSDPFKGVSIFASAKSGANVEACFALLANRLMRKTIAPPRDTVDLPKFSSVIDTKVHTADKLIDEFCKELGGYERAMPVTRTVFRNSKCDFEHLRQEDLEDILSALTDIILDEKGVDPATEFKDRMQVLIDECAD